MSLLKCIASYDKIKVKNGGGKGGNAIGAVFATTRLNRKECAKEERRKKKYIALFMAILVWVMSVMPAGAAFAATRDLCSVCYTGLVDDCCTKGSIVQTETTTHEYGWLWDRKTCTVTWKFRRGEQKCLDCGHVFQSPIALHECIEVHSACGKGTVSCCPYRASFSGD